MWQSVTVWLATGFGLGHLPVASGTFGSLLGIPLAWWLLGRSWPWQAGSVALLLLIGVPICDVGAEALGGGDVPAVVADEFLAFPLAVLGLAALRSPVGMLLAFVVYRFFDITKLPPIDSLEAIGGGIGIMLDDSMAAIYSWLLLAAILLVWRRLRPALR
ncbi:phosphatidylglycerophosphatase A [Halomonas urumqiensis]|uniref:Phosphatidylglycerophosphatase A n=1 Tax=Halomonas urumqiensis TaxID=1684789 RepID=A0A2N7UDZ5_9GAMM|nr:phosphatidylglycerophosphatase A [Halomonas urumqiensis]PTB04301.1 phosphatidylglycerophosphatase A [Halomonas urumqiensis]